MSRFFVASDDDEEESEMEEEEKKEEAGLGEDSQTNSTKNKPKKETSKGSGKKKQILSEKQKRFLELYRKLHNILDKFTLQDYTNATLELQDLRKIYKKADKVILINGNPHFLIRNCLEIQIRLNTLSDVKGLRKFNSFFKDFIQPFEEELQKCKENPEEYNKDEEDYDTLDDNGEDYSDEQDSDSEREKWFDSSDEENDKPSISKPQRTRRDPKSNELVNIHESAEDAIRELDDRVIKNELRKYADARSKGRITATTQRLEILLEVVIDEQLEKQAQLEICHTITLGPVDQPISTSDWNLLLKILPDLVDEGKTLIPLFQRLDKDFWAKSIDTRVLFTPEVSALHTNMPKYIEILKLFIEGLKKEEEFAACVNLQIILISHLYHKAENDVMPITLSILELSSMEEVFDAETALDIKIRATMYLANNLAYRNYPRAAYKLMLHLPDIQDNYPFTRILWNRTLAVIGTAAFKSGMYKIAYDSLRQISSTDNVTKKEKQNVFGKLIYPPWLHIDPASLIVINYAAAIILDLPYLANPKDEGNIIIKFRSHKDLQREIVTTHPETISQRVALTIHHARNGDWKKSFDAINAELTKYFPNCDRYLRDLKKASLCCFLLTANQYYDDISIEQLMKKFSFTNDEVMQIIQKMNKGHGPIENAVITFHADFSDDRKYIIFQKPRQATPLADFDQLFENKLKEVSPKIVSMDKETK